MEQSETYYLPVNFTDAGRLFGAFETRNAIEAVALGVPVLFLCIYLLPLALTPKIIGTMIILVPVGGFALIGLNDDSLTRFLSNWLHWLGRRTILTYRGETNKHEFQRTVIRRRRQGR